MIKKEVLEYLKISLRELTRFGKSQISEKRLEEIEKVEVKKEEIKIIVPSLRIDSVISEVLHISRNKANVFIESERVLINFQIETKLSKEIKPKDMITIRGKGRYEVKEVLGNTKKGNLIVLIEKYI